MNLFHFGGGQVFRLVFGVNAAEPDFARRVLPVVNHPRAAAPAVAFGRHTDFSQAAGSGNDVTRTGALEQANAQVKLGVIVQQVLLRNIGIPDQVRDAIEKKLAAEQNALAMQYVLQKETQEAERKRIEARGISDFQQIVTQGISDKLLAWKGIEATLEIAKSPNAKVVIIGNPQNGLPIVFDTNTGTPGTRRAAPEENK